jgi:hypothetical protein
MAMDLEIEEALFTAACPITSAAHNTVTLDDPWKCACGAYTLKM